MCRRFLSGEKMTKTGYISNAAKMLAVAASLLLIANIIVFIGDLGIPFATDIGEKISGLSTYVVLVLCYVALNGEGIGHKRGRNRGAKKKTGYLKLLTVICFVSIYFKGALRGSVMTLSAFEAKGLLARLGLAVVYVVTSYSFLFLAVSFWYIMRDSNFKKLCALEVFCFALSGIYSFYKLFNYAFFKFGMISPWQGFADLFARDRVASVLCILQYAFIVVMLVAASKHYNSLSKKEEVENEKTNKLLFRAKQVYSEKGVGIDTFEDDFLSRQ